VRAAARRWRPSRLVALLLIALVVAGCSSRSRYPYDWSIFFESVFTPNARILSGLGLTVVIAVVAQIVGVILGVLAAIARLSRNALFRAVAGVYIWIFRGTPLLVQLTFVFFGLSATGIYTWPPIDIGGIRVAGEVQAGIFALGVNEGAYMTEIVRAGILSVDPGQMEAAKSLGMTYGKAMRRIVLPQAARVIIPPLGNEFNNMLKTTSLLVLISVPELYVIFSRKQGNVFAPFEFFLAAAVWYLLLTTIWGVIQAWIERRLGAGFGAERPPGFFDRLFGNRLRPDRDPSLTSGSR
jgi:polar amino acid transport system permease protein